MKKRFLFVGLLAFTLFTLSACEEKKTVVKPGIEVLKSNGFKQLQGKKVGLVTNPTGVDNDLVSTVDILFNAPGVELVALFGPEHGVRGDIHAGDKIDSNIDSKTGLPIHSLYGKTRKPTKEMLEGLDAIIYDIQDNGCRSFTYISTMGLVMEAAAENDIEVIILDRPNPLGGERIEGNLVEEDFISFVSQFKIPYIYGLTCGELAQLLNGESMLSGKCKLTVVPMEGWERDMVFSETGVPWVLPSPHMPHDVTSYYYPATGILGELYYLSIGVGYTLPFQLMAAEWIDAQMFSDEMNGLNLPGVRFRPIHIKPFYSTDQGKTIQGVQIYITDIHTAALTDIQFYAIEVLAKLYPEHAVFTNANDKRFRMFDQVTGSDNIRKLLSERHKFEDMREYWYKDVESFRTLSEPYKIY